MGVINFDIEIPSPIPPAKMFKASVLDADNLAHKMMPDAIKSVETLEGDGGPGTIKLTTFGEGSQHKFVKQRVDAIDKENFTYSYTIIEGDVLTNTFESIFYHIKIVASPDGGSICKTRSIYTTKGDAHISEDEIKAGKEKASQIIKAIEAYLSANPDYC
ncbi:major allergen Pru ar 1-like [Actinidia eriantha]|uniref:major allergen Pru ar 1-like n=1 Tax=Actinidia eriantha TaxID=165200 RepID=UPI00258812C3|nr:major allergen Pru ar 1-like [Actinidia eriantha]XP_057487173.1 major allergen Pru ar 1-like [Actinidia eriantha]